MFEEGCQTDKLMTQHPQRVASLKPWLSTLDLDCECTLLVNIGCISDHDVIANIIIS